MCDQKISKVHLNVILFRVKAVIYNYKMTVLVIFLIIIE